MVLEGQPWQAPWKRMWTTPEGEGVAEVVDAALGGLPVDDAGGVADGFHLFDLAALAGVAALDLHAAVEAKLEGGDWVGRGQLAAAGLADDHQEVARGDQVLEVGVQHLAHVG